MDAASTDDLFFFFFSENLMVWRTSLFFESTRHMPNNTGCLGSFGLPVGHARQSRHTINCHPAPDKNSSQQEQQPTRTLRFSTVHVASGEDSMFDPWSSIVASRWLLLTYTQASLIFSLLLIGSFLPSTIVSFYSQGNISRSSLFSGTYKTTVA